VAHSRCGRWQASVTVPPVDKDAPGCAAHPAATHAKVQIEMCRLWPPTQHAGRSTRPAKEVSGLQYVAGTGACG